MSVGDNVLGSKSNKYDQIALTDRSHGKDLSVGKKTKGPSFLNEKPSLAVVQKKK